MSNRQNDFNDKLHSPQSTDRYNYLENSHLIPLKSVKIDGFSEINVILFKI